MVTLFNADTRTHLEFPLSRSNLGIDTRNFHTRLHAQPQMSIGNVSSKRILCAHAAIIGTLCLLFVIPQWEQRNRVKQKVFLFQPEPGFFVTLTLKQFCCPLPMVIRQRFIKRRVGITQDEFVRTFAKGVAKHRSRFQDNLGVMTMCLVCGATVVIPRR